MKIEELREKIEQHKDACYEEFFDAIWERVTDPYERGYIEALEDILYLMEGEEVKRHVCL